MNQIEIGKLIAQKRIEKGLTQKQLAECLFVTDKAVSKWERGLSLPDALLIYKISNLLEIDIEMFLEEGLKKDDWIGVLNVNETDGIYRKNLGGQPMLFYLCSLFLLLGIKKIYINCNDEEFIESLDLPSLGFVIQVNELIPKNKQFVINDNFIIYGVSLTRTLMNSMSLDTNVRFFFEEMPLPFEIVIPNSTLNEKKLGRGYLFFSMNNVNFSIVDAIICELNRNNYMKINDIYSIIKNRG